MKEKKTSEGKPGKRYHFRYRRLHVFHLDVAAVLLLTVAGWSLWPRFPEDDGDVRGGRVEGVIVSPEAESAESLLNLPTLFAFRSPIGFVGGEDMSSKIFFIEEPHSLPPSPENPDVDFAPKAPMRCKWPGEKTIWGGEIPLAPDFAPSAAVAATDMANGGREAGVIVSDEGVKMPPMNGLKLKGEPGMSFRVHVVFGADGWAEAAVLLPNALTPADAAAVERAVMRMTGPANSSCWVTFRVPDCHVGASQDS